MTGFFIAIVAVLVIVCLVVRDQTEYKLSRMRADLMGLRSEEQRLDEMRKEVEQMVRWVGEGLNRADKRQRTAEQDGRELDAILAGEGIDTDADAAEATSAQEQTSS